MNKTTMFDEIIGWIGTIAIFGAYLLVSFNIILSTNIIYQLMNITGSICLFYIAFKKHAYQLEVLNILWAFVGIIALINIFIESKNLFN